MRLLVIAIACCLGAAVNASAAEISRYPALPPDLEMYCSSPTGKAGRIHAILMGTTALSLNVVLPGPA